MTNRKFNFDLPQANINNLPKVKRSDFEQTSFFTKQFCLPKEIKLVEYNGGRDYRDTRENIQIVDRVDPLDTSPIFRDISPIDFSTNRPDPGDGLISLVKNLNVRVAICVTVFSEDKNMLKRTLEGIRRNYYTFYEKGGIHSHEIAVVIMFDGIENLNNSKQSDKNMFNLFREFDLINGFRKKEYLLAKEKERESSINEEEDSLINDIENFSDQMLFTEEEYEVLESLLLENQYNRYKSMSELLEFSENIENKKLHYMPIESLPIGVKQALIIRAKEYLEENGVEDITENDKELLDYIAESLSQEKIDILKIDALKDAVFIAKEYLKSRESTAIMYQMALPLDSVKNGEINPKLNIFTVVKYSNRGKLSSHLWFFEGFCNMINPSCCVLMDCGLEPEKDSIFKVWAHIETYKKNCGGVCGYMKLKKESPYDESGDRHEHEAESFFTSVANFFVDVQKAQIFEYHISHLMDKPFESLTGYIHVLPGAFSGYNWEALKSERFKVMRSDGQVFEKDIEKRTKQQILKKYLKTVIYNEILDNIEEANMYLAEDRILCLEIYTKKKNKFNLEYLPDSYAYVDPITTLPRLLSQRKRWINGSWFALDFVLKNKGRVSESSHSCWDKFWFHLNMFHAEIMKYVSYLSISFFFITLHLMVLEFSQTTIKNYFMRSYSITEAELVDAKIFTDFFSIRSVINSFTKVFDFLYICTVGILVYRSMTIHKQDTKTKRSFNTLSTWFGIFGIFTTVLIFVNFFQAILNNQSDLVNIRGLSGIFTQQTFIYLLIVIVGTHIVIVLSAMSFRTYFEIVTSILSYFFFIPSYINLFFIYAFCRIDDLSWGTKGLDQETKSKEIETRKKFADDKIKFAINWLSVNIIISLLLVGLANNFNIQNYIIWIFSAYFAIMMIIKVIFVIIYLLQYYIFKRIKVRLMASRTKEDNFKEGLKLKRIVNEFITKMKEEEIDEHIKQMNEDMIKKKLFDLAMINEKEKIIEQQNSELRHSMIRRTPAKETAKEGNSEISERMDLESYIKKSDLDENENENGRPRRISFKELQRISNVGNQPPRRSKFAPLK